jgi:hypothetical protein
MPVVSPVGDQVAVGSALAAGVRGVEQVGQRVVDAADERVPRRRSRRDPERHAGVGKGLCVHVEPRGGLDVDAELIEERAHGRVEMDRGTIERVRSLVRPADGHRATR